MEWMEPLESKQRRRLQAKADGQLMLGLGHAQTRQALPDANRQKCVTLLGRMLLAAVKAQPENKTHER
jgi:hypothetical protein